MCEFDGDRYTSFVMTIYRKNRIKSLRKKPSRGLCAHVSTELREWTEINNSQSQLWELEISGRCLQNQLEKLFCKVQSQLSLESQSPEFCFWLLHFFLCAAVRSGGNHSVLRSPRSSPLRYRVTTRMAGKWSTVWEVPIGMPRTKCTQSFTFKFSCVFLTCGFWNEGMIYSVRITKALPLALKEIHCFSE